YHFTDDVPLAFISEPSFGLDQRQFHHRVALAVITASRNGAVIQFLPELLCLGEIAGILVCHRKIVSNSISVGTPVQLLFGFHSLIKKLKRIITGSHCQVFHSKPVLKISHHVCVSLSLCTLNF